MWGGGEEVTTKPNRGHTSLLGLQLPPLAPRPERKRLPGAEGPPEEKKEEKKEQRSGLFFSPVGGGCGAQHNLNKA